MDVIHGTRVWQRKPCSSEPFIEKPCPAGERTFWLGFDPGFDLCRIDLVHGLGYDAHVECFILQSEFEVSCSAFFGSIDKGVLFNDSPLFYICFPRRLAAPGLDGWRRAIQAQMRLQPILSDWEFAHRGTRPFKNAFAC